MFSQSITIIFINGKSTKPPADFIKKTLIFSYRVTTELELSTTIEKIERSLIEHRKKEYKKLGFSSPPDNVHLRPGIEFGNAKIIIDDLHKEVVDIDTTEHPEFRKMVSPVKVLSSIFILTWYSWAKRFWDLMNTKQVTFTFEFQNVAQVQYMT